MATTAQRVTALAGATLIALVGAYEGLRTDAYIDPVGIPTICYGSTKDVELGQSVSKEYCDSLLTKELSEFGVAVLELVRVPLNQNQYDALVSFTYNVGVGAFSRSTLLKKLNRGDYDGAAKEFDRWIYAGGRKLAGLKKRRQAERKLFETPVRPTERV